MRIFARPTAGRPSYRVLIAVTVPIVLMILANLGRTWAAAGDVIGLEAVRRPARDSRPRVPAPDVQPVQVLPTEPPRELVLSRNPFAFELRSVPPAPAPTPAPIAPPLEASLDLPPSLSLIGIATATRADGRAERTAIITGPSNDIYFAREGEAVMTRYRVDAVLPDSVRLVDEGTGASLSLLMR